MGGSHHFQNPNQGAAIWFSPAIHQRPTVVSPLLFWLLKYTSIFNLLNLFVGDIRLLLLKISMLVGTGDLLSLTHIHFLCCYPPVNQHSYGNPFVFLRNYLQWWIFMFFFHTSYHLHIWLTHTHTSTPIYLSIYIYIYWYISISIVYLGNIYISSLHFHTILFYLGNIYISSLHAHIYIITYALYIIVDMMYPYQTNIYVTFT